MLNLVPCEAHPNLSTLSQPLNRLLLQNSPWMGTKACQTPFSLSKIDDLQPGAGSLQCQASFEAGCSWGQPQTRILCSAVVQYTQAGWATSIDPQLNPFQSKQHEHTVEANCLIWRMCVTIPAKFQSHILPIRYTLIPHPSCTCNVGVSSVVVEWVAAVRKVGKSAQTVFLGTTTVKIPDKEICC